MHNSMFSMRTCSIKKYEPYFFHHCSKLRLGTSYSILIYVKKKLDFLHLPVETIKFSAEASVYVECFPNGLLWEIFNNQSRQKLFYSHAKNVGFMPSSRYFSPVIFFRRRSHSCNITGFTCISLWLNFSDVKTYPQFLHRSNHVLGGGGWGMSAPSLQRRSHVVRVWSMNKSRWMKRNILYIRYFYLMKCVTSFHYSLSHSILVM